MHVFLTRLFLAVFGVRCADLVAIGQATAYSEKRCCHPFLQLNSRTAIEPTPKPTRVGYERTVMNPLREDHSVVEICACKACLGYVRSTCNITRFVDERFQKVHRVKLGQWWMNGNQPSWYGREMNCEVQSPNNTGTGRPSYVQYIGRVHGILTF